MASPRRGRRGRAARGGLRSASSQRLTFGRHVGPPGSMRPRPRPPGRGVHPPQDRPCQHQEADLRVIVGQHREGSHGCKLDDLDQAGGAGGIRPLDPGRRRDPRRRAEAAAGGRRRPAAASWTIPNGRLSCCSRAPAVAGDGDERRAGARLRDRPAQQPDLPRDHGLRADQLLDGAPGDRAQRGTSGCGCRCSRMALSVDGATGRDRGRRERRRSARSGSATIDLFLVGHRPDGARPHRPAAPGPTTRAVVRLPRARLLRALQGPPAADAVRHGRQPGPLPGQRPRPPPRPPTRHRRDGRGAVPARAGAARAGRRPGRPGAGRAAGRATAAIPTWTRRRPPAHVEPHVQAQAAGARHQLPPARRRDPACRGRSGC